MAIYFIDGDNAPGSRTRGIENLAAKDIVVIFYAKSNSHYSSKDIRQALEKKQQHSFLLCRFVTVRMRLILL